MNESFQRQNLMMKTLRNTITLTLYLLICSYHNYSYAQYYISVVNKKMNTNMTFKSNLSLELPTSI